MKLIHSIKLYLSTICVVEQNKSIGISNALQVIEVNRSFLQNAKSKKQKLDEEGAAVVTEPVPNGSQTSDDEVSLSCSIVVHKVLVIGFYKH